MMWVMKTKIILLFLAFLMSTPINFFGQSELDKNLILHYPFDGDGSELQKNGKNFKIDDSPTKNFFAWLDGKDGKPRTSLFFKPAQQGLKPGINVSPTKMPEITYTAWVFGTPYGYLFGTTLPQSEASKIVSRNLLFANDRVEAGYMIYNERVGEDQATFLSSSKLPDDEWNFVALVVNAKDSSMTLYAGVEYYQVQDGDLLKKVFHTKKGGDLIIGNSVSAGTNLQFQGRVDDIKIFNKALTAAELTQLSGIEFTDAKIRFEREELIKKILIIALLLFYVVSIIFVIVTFFREKKYKPVSEEEFVQFVAASKSNPEISVTNDLAYKYVEDSFAKWPEVNREGDDIYRAPRKKNQIKDTYEALEKARNLKPSEKYIIDRMNELGGICNDLSKRKFYGNKFLPGAALILPIIFIIIEAMGNLPSSSINAFIVMLLPIASYILSSFAPTYLVANRKHNSGGILGTVIGAIIGAGGAIAATEHYNQITWSNGSKTVESDTGSNMASLLIGIIVIVVALLAAIILTGLAAIIAFFRNYVFYI